MFWAHKHKGFTIVELLIVVVVIAILASITIVAFNGIQERARMSAALAEAKQTHSAISVWQTTNNDNLPLDLASLNINSSDVDYWPYNDFSEYCISFDNGKGGSYYSLSSAKTTLEEGSCTDINWVAGDPLAYTDTPGSNVPLATPITGAADITLYTVFSIIDADSYYSGFAGLNPGITDNRFYFQGSTVGSPTAGYRIDTPAFANYTGQQTNVRLPGFHIGWMQSSSNATVRSFAFDKTTAHASTSMNPGTGWNFTHMFLSANSASYTPYAAVVYSGAHDLATRDAVMNWLSKKYNTGLTF